jgi:hypothetical protein
MSADANPSEEFVSQLLSLETTLLDPAVRRDRSRVSELLAEDFVEFGSSGRVWTRNRILDLLAIEEYLPPTIEDFECRQISSTAIFATYRAVRVDALTGTRTVTLRSSIWKRETGVWRIHFHQGTRVP